MMALKPELEKRGLLTTLTELQKYLSLYHKPNYLTLL